MCVRRFYNTYPCIILTAKGQPDVATRLFLRKLKTTLKIPVLALVSCITLPPNPSVCPANFPCQPIPGRF